MEHPPTFILSLIFLSVILASPVSALTINFQSIGLSDQNIKVFDDSGALVTTVNTTSSLDLNTTTSDFYTLQIQPAASNLDYGSMLGSFSDFLGQNQAIVLVVFGLAVILAIAIGRRR